MSTLIENEDFVQIIKDLKQRVSDLERQQRTIGTSTGVLVNGDTIGLGGAITGNNAKGLNIRKDLIRLFTNNPSGDITAQMDITWDSWLGTINIPNLSKLTLLPVPATSSSAGEVGQFATDTSHFYVCIGTNSWKRISLTSF